MDHDQRKRAAFYANLASIHSLDELHPGQRLQLEDELHRLAEALGRSVVPWPRKIPPSRPELAELLRRHPPVRSHELMLRHGLLEDLHRISKEWIGDLIDIGAAWRPREDFPEPIWTRHGDEVHQFVEPADMWKLFVLDLERLLSEPPFRFRRCPVCKAVFVRVKRQKYCSPNCTYRAAATTRKEERRDYMRRYMAMRRARQKRKKRTREA